MCFRSFVLLAYLSLALTATAQWTFSSGRAIVAVKGDVEGKVTSFEPNGPLASRLPLGSKDVLKLSMTLKDGNSAGRPHQAFLLIKDSYSELETFFPLNVKESTGKAKVDISHKDIPAHLIDTSELDLSIALGGFGATPGSIISVGKVTPVVDPSMKALLEKQKLKDIGEDVELYQPKHEIRHIFHPEPKSPPQVITLAFLAAVMASYVGLFSAWFPILGANFKHLNKALQTAPLSHSLFFASLVSLEGLFFYVLHELELVPDPCWCGCCRPDGFLERKPGSAGSQGAERERGARGSVRQTV